MVRLFIALPLPVIIKDELSKAQKNIKKLELVEGNFVSKENLHLTLQFLDDQPEEKIPTIINQLNTIETLPFDLRLGPLGYFSETALKAIWVSLTGPGLIGLNAALKEATREFAPPEEHPFKAHITLLRIKKTRRQVHFLKALSEIKISPLSFEASRFALMKSCLSHLGAQYQELAHFELKSPKCKSHIS